VSDMVSNFLSDPFPERITFFSNTLDEDINDCPMLSFGVQVITKDRGGRRIPPSKRVVIAVGDGFNPELLTFDVDAHTAREIAKRLNEFADACIARLCRL
jgi:hypothetical protein